MHTIENQLLTIKNDLTEKSLSRETIIVFLKEQLQDYVLDHIYNNSEFSGLIFYGGTCLRKLYDLNRLSEDLDFEHEREVDLEKLSASLTDYFHKSLSFRGVEAKIQSGAIINRITLKFEILHKLGLAPTENEKLHIKVEINPIEKIVSPTTQTPYLSKNLSMIINHYPIDVLMSGKMLACLDRVFKKGDSNITVKGRDYYDLVWYMQKGVTPDEKKLKAKDSSYSVEKVFELLDEKVAGIKSSDLIVDLEPFFENKKFIREWCENFHELYKRYREDYKNHSS
jgi:predicted nucleotidyltransferase component of viral defense system